MKTVIALLPNYFGGGETITSMLASSLSNVGYRFVLVTDMRWVQGRECELRGIYSDIVTLPLVGEHANYELTRRISEVIKPYQADVLWMIGDDYSDINILREALAPNGKVVFQLHSVPYYQIRMKASTPFKRLRERLFKSYSKRYHRRMAQTLRDVDVMVVLCDGYRQQLVNEFPDATNKIITVYNPAPVEPDLQPPTDTIAYVGRLTFSDKRVDNLLRIFALAKPWQHGWKVRIIGDGPERKNLESLASELLLRDVEFCGFQSPPNLNGAQIICLTSEIEGWPTSLIEGMQQGAVPVAFDCSAGVGEILADGRGIAIASGDLKGYADALVRLMESPELREDYVSKASPFLRSLRLNNIVEEWQKIL